jgi:hypothetical protein
VRRGPKSHLLWPMPLEEHFFGGSPDS